MHDGANHDGANAHGTNNYSEPSEIDGLGYEEARDALIEVVRGLEAGGLSLEDSLALWEKGEALAKVCERHLEGARKRIDDKLASIDNSDAEAEQG